MKTLVKLVMLFGLAFGVGYAQPTTILGSDSVSASRTTINNNFTNLYNLITQTVNSSPGSCGDSTHVCAITTNAQGKVTAQQVVSIPIPSIASVTNVLVGNGTGGASDSGIAASNIALKNAANTFSLSITAPGFVGSDSTHTGKMEMKPGTCANFANSVTAGNYGLFFDSQNSNKLSKCDSGGSQTAIEISGTGGDASTNTSTSVDGEMVLFSGTGGKTLKRATMTGIPKITSGVPGNATAGSDYSAPGTNETTSGNRTFTGAIDASGAASTKPSKSGLTANLPATCSVGEEYFATDATAGRNKYYCTATNTWTQQAAGGGSGCTTSGTSIQKGDGASGCTTANQSDISTEQYAAGGGTANAQTATYSPAVTSLTAGLRLCWLPTAANSTTTPTFAPNGLTAHTIVKAGGALAQNDLITTAVACAVYNATATQWELQNPQTVAAGGSGNPGSPDNSLQYRVNASTFGGAALPSGTDPEVVMQTSSTAPEVVRPFVGQGIGMVFRSVMKGLMLPTSYSGGTNIDLMTTDTGHASIAGPIPYIIPAANTIGSTLTFTNLGSGGTNGTGYAMSFTGSCGIAGTYDISSGSISNYAITNHGNGSCPSNVTVSFPNGSISGAAATVTFYSVDRVLMLISFDAFHSSGGACLLLSDNAGTFTPLLISGAPTNGTATTPMYVFDKNVKPAVQCSNSTTVVQASAFEMDATSGYVTKMLPGGGGTSAQVLYTIPAGSHAMVINRTNGTSGGAQVNCMNNTAGSVAYTAYAVPPGGSTGANNELGTVASVSSGTTGSVPQTATLAGGWSLQVVFGASGTVSNSSCWATFLTDTGSH